MERLMILRRSVATALLAAGVLGLGACAGPGARDAAARDAASTFARAVAQGDLPAACGLLVRATAEALEDDDGSCPAALADAGLDDPGDATGSQVWGRGALVTFSGGDVFLAEVDGRWRVTAAGCTLHEESPASCDVEAG